MQGSTNLNTLGGRCVRWAAQGTSNTIPYLPRISGFKTSLGIFRLGRTHPSAASVPLLAPTPPPALNVHQPALLADPVGGDTLPLRAEPPSQTPAKTVKVTGRALRGAVQDTWAAGPLSPRSLRTRKWTLEQALGAPLLFI